jgi:hypothetical protein
MRIVENLHQFNTLKCTRTKLVWSWHCKFIATLSPVKINRHHFQGQNVHLIWTPYVFAHLHSFKKTYEKTTRSIFFHINVSLLNIRFHVKIILIITSRSIDVLPYVCFFMLLECFNFNNHHIGKRPFLIIIYQSLLSFVNELQTKKLFILILPSSNCQIFWPNVIQHHLIKDNNLKGFYNQK